MKTLLLSKDDVENSLCMKDVIESVKKGYLAYNAGKVDQPDIVSMEIPEYNGETDIKSCCDKEGCTMSVKIASGFYDNGKENSLPSMIGMILLFDAKTGFQLCVMDGSLITGVRTGAAGAISCELLARPDSKTVAVIGAGGQARMQIYALRELMDIEEVRVFSPSGRGLDAYKSDVEKTARVRVVPCATAEEAMRCADIAISTTPSKKYLVGASLVRPGMHIVAVGADMAGKNEWDPAVFRGAKVVVDSVSQCVSRGETRNAIVSGVITEGDIYAEIGALLNGEKPLRQNPDEITIFDTTGMAIQDNVTAAGVYKYALEHGLGSSFEFI